MERAELISRLKDDLHPSRPHSLKRRVVSWLASCLLFLLLAFLSTGTRADLNTILSSPRFAIETLALVIAGVTSGVLALFLSVPTARTRRSTVVVLGAAMVWIISIITTFILQMEAASIGEGVRLAGMACSTELLLFSAIPAGVLLLLMRFGANLSAHLSGLLILLSAGFLSMVALQFSCAQDHTAHLLLYHLFPVALLGTVGWVAGGRLFSFERRLEQKKEELFSDRNSRPEG
ncbi:NrsF family protein [bacterium]|nr:NrsF family protein [bacterium]